jgi:hypothetical protein
VSQNSAIFPASLAGQNAAEAIRTAPVSPAAAVTDWIDQHRHLWFTLVAIFLALSFNGQWHLGPDSAGYRQLAHNLAAHGKYFFRTDIPGVDEYHNEQGTRYPGLPLLLAALERFFGEAALPPLIMMMAMAVLSLFAIYRLLLYSMPRWLAVCVVVGVGTNPRFIQYANEILSDVPFLLGVVITLLGFEQVMSAKNRTWVAIGIANTFIGMLLAAAMRPTFIILGAALVVACLWGILRGRIGMRPPVAQDIPRAAVRWRSALLIAAFMVATIVFVGVVDIRSRQGSFLSGGYEERMVSKLENFGSKVAPLLPDNIGQLLEDALPMAVMGFRSGWGLIPLGTVHLGFGAGFSLIVLTSGVCLARRNMLWGMFVLAAMVALILAGSVPRYFLMILPLLLAGWALFVQALARRFRSIAVSRFVMWSGLFFLLAINVIASSTFLLTQRGFSKLFDPRHHWTGFHHVGFIHAYDFGRWAGFDQFATALHNATSRQDKIIGPEANVLTFLADRQVYEPILGNRTKAAGKLLHLAVFPADPDWHKSTGDYEQALKQFLRTLHRVEGTVIAGPKANLALAPLAKAPTHHLTPAEKLAHARKMAAHRLRAQQLRASTRP